MTSYESLVVELGKLKEKLSSYYLLAVYEREECVKHIEKIEQVLGRLAHLDNTVNR